MLSVGPEIETLHPQATSLDMALEFYESTHKNVCKLLHRLLLANARLMLQSSLSKAGLSMELCITSSRDAALPLDYAEVCNRCDVVAVPSAQNRTTHVRQLLPITVLNSRFSLRSPRLPIRCMCLLCHLEPNAPFARSRC